MGVMKRVQRLGKYMDDYDKEVVAKMKRVFAPRCSVLRELEGWYTTQDNKSFKFSCNYNDILRAADSKHFTTCFRPEGAHRLQPLKRLLDPNWAVIFMPDRGGNVMARAWVQANAVPELILSYSQVELDDDTIRARLESRKPYLNVTHVYGNNLSVATIINTLDSVAIWEVTSDIYL